MEQPLIGTVILFAGNFAPRGWAKCDGQMLAITNHQALFSLLGTTYGGDGRTTFSLPDLRGRSPLGEGTGPGLQKKYLGERTSTKFNINPEMKATIETNIGQEHGLAMTYIIALDGILPSRS